MKWKCKTETTNWTGWTQQKKWISEQKAVKWSKIETKNKLWYDILWDGEEARDTA